MRIFFPLLICACLGGMALQADVPEVATDIAPVHGVVARVMQGVGAPQLIIPPNASPHGYAMRPSEARALGRADLLVWVGPALTPWLSEPVKALAGEAEQLLLLDTPGTTLLSYRTGVEFASHEADHDHSDEDHHDHGGVVDPHAWLDPANGAVWAVAVAEALARLDPEHADTYRANAASLTAELATLEAEYKSVLKARRDRPYIVFHDAYQYFEERFDLQASAAISLGDAARPGAARIAALRGLVAETGASCAFTEPQFNADLLQTVIEGNKVALAVLDPMGASVSAGPDFYPQLLRGMAASFADCLSSPD